MSRLPRFFIDPSQAAGSRITIIGDDLRHVRTVLRQQPGDKLTLLDGQGTEYTVRIVALERDGIVTEIEDQVTRQLPGPRLVLCQGLPKSDKMDWIVQKATELGVASIVPVIAERTIVKVRDEEKRVARWRKICREAAMQSSRMDIPKVGTIQLFKDFLGTLSPDPLTLFLLPWEEGTTPIKHVLRTHPAVQNIIILIGPEGGISSSEAELAKARGFHAVSLGPNILRTETAAIAVLSMLLYEYA